MLFPKVVYDGVYIKKKGICNVWKKMLLESLYRRRNEKFKKKKKNCYANNILSKKKKKTSW